MNIHVTTTQAKKQKLVSAPEAYPFPIQVLTRRNLA